MSHGFDRISRVRVLTLRTLHAGIERAEEPCGIRLEQPDVEIVVMQGRWLRRRMALHGTVERLPEQRWPFLDAGRERNEPLGADELQLVADWYIEKDLRLHGIDGRPEERSVDEMNAHARAGVVLHTEHAREVTI